jgi:hypothetical protein
MAANLSTIVIDARDHVALARFWRAVLGWPVIEQDDDPDDPWVEIGLPDRSATTVLIQRVPEPKSGKNRLHLDLTPSGTTQSEELERLLGLGARHADIGQGEETWVVLADPEDNEFCLLSAPGGSAAAP